MSSFYHFTIWKEKKTWQILCYRKIDLLWVQMSPHAACDLLPHGHYIGCYESWRLVVLLVINNAGVWKARLEFVITIVLELDLNMTSCKTSDICFHLKTVLRKFHFSTKLLNYPFLRLVSWPFLTIFYKYWVYFKHICDISFLKSCLDFL